MVQHAAHRCELCSAACWSKTGCPADPPGRQQAEAELQLPKHSPLRLPLLATAAGSPDLIAARKVADFLGTIHTEFTFTVGGAELWSRAKPPGRRLGLFRAPQAAQSGWCW